jgi:hypothetical protein
MQITRKNHFNFNTTCSSALILKIYCYLVCNWLLVFQFAILKLKDKDTQNYNFACSFVWVWNLVADIEGGTWAEGVWE